MNTKELLEKFRDLAIREHRYCEDTWYSCPKEEYEGCADPDQGDKCNCGADRINGQIEELYAELSKRLHEE